MHRLRTQNEEKANETHKEAETQHFTIPNPESNARSQKRRASKKQWRGGS